MGLSYFSSSKKERTHHHLGFAYYELGRWDEAKEEFEKALQPYVFRRYLYGTERLSYGPCLL
jgi:tetratricopeptide (TPR) repeat protein